MKSSRLLDNDIPRWFEVVTQEVKSLVWD